MTTFLCSTCKEPRPINTYHKYVCARCSSRKSSEAQRRFRGQIKRCPGCNEDKPAWIRTTCKICYNESMKAYQKNKYAKLWEWYFDLKKRPCTDCGVEFHPAAMEWDHRNSEDKTKAVSTLLFQGASKDSILKEIAKCELVCANCHRVRTWIRKRLT